MKTVRIVCEWCGEEFDKYKVEYDRQIRCGGTRFFCSRSHAARYGNSKRSPGTSTAVLCKWARRAWVALYGSDPLCEICEKPADVHHNDGDRTNNSPENLRALCRSHHIALENHNRVCGRGKYTRA